MKTIPMSFRLPEEVVKKIDKKAKREYSTRSEVIKRYIIRGVLDEN